MASYAMDLLDEALQVAADAGGTAFEPRAAVDGEPAMGSCCSAPGEAELFLPTTPATACTDYIGKATALAATVRSCSPHAPDLAPQRGDLAADCDGASVASSMQTGAVGGAFVHGIYQTPGAVVSLDIGLSSTGDGEDSPPTRGRRGKPDRQTGSARVRALSPASASSGEASISNAMLFGY